MVVAGSVHADGVVGADPVEDLSVFFEPAEALAVGDLVSVELVVFEPAEGSLAHAVLAGGGAPGADVRELRSRGDVGAKP